MNGTFAVVTSDAEATATASVAPEATAVVAVALAVPLRMLSAIDSEMAGVIAAYALRSVYVRVKPESLLKQTMPRG